MSKKFNLKAERARFNLTQKELAELIGVSAVTLSKIESNHKSIKSLTGFQLAELSNLTNFSIDEILKEE